MKFFHITYNPYLSALKMPKLIIIIPLLPTNDTTVIQGFYFTTVRLLDNITNRISGETGRLILID